MHVWLGINKGRVRFKNILGFSSDFEIHHISSRKLGWSDINMLAGVLISFFLSSYWSAGLGTFLQAPAFASHWLRDFAICTATTGENYQYNATHLRHLRQANQLYHW